MLWSLLAYRAVELVLLENLFFWRLDSRDEVLVLVNLDERALVIDGACLGSMVLLWLEACDVELPGW